MSDLATRLTSLNTKKFKSNEMYNIIRDFIVNPLIVEMIESNNQMHKVRIARDGSYITSLELVREKPKKYGLWYNICRAFNPWELVFEIRYNGGLFVCRYEKYGYLSLIDKMKEQYYDKLQKSFNCEFVVINKE